jgi:putative glutamine amidotransferase
MPPRIAIPMPHSSDPEYAERSIPQYERAVKLAGGEPVRIPLDLVPAQVMKIVERCDGILLPGSKADVDPAKFGAIRSCQTAPADVPRDTVDELLMLDAYNRRKPILGICYGLQSLNVYKGGSLVQHIPDFLPENLRTRVNHEAGKAVAVAHEVKVERESRLATIVCGDSQSRLSSGAWPGTLMASSSGEIREGSGFGRANMHLERNGILTPARNDIVIPVNSSHHQSADAIGDGLRVVARCSEDNIIEGLEGTDPEHFVLAVQWHPERSVDEDQASRAIFRALIQAAE